MTARKFQSWQWARTCEAVAEARGHVRRARWLVERAEREAAAGAAPVAVAWPRKLYGERRWARRIGLGAAAIAAGVWAEVVRELWKLL